MEYQLGDNVWVTALTDGAIEYGMHEPPEPWEGIIIWKKFLNGVYLYVVFDFNIERDPREDNFAISQCESHTIFKEYSEAEKDYKNRLKRYIERLEVEVKESEDLLEKWEKS